MIALDHTKVVFLHAVFWTYSTLVCYAVNNIRRTVNNNSDT